MNHPSGLETLPRLQTDNEVVDLVYRIALGDVVSNIVADKNGRPLLLAGLGYDRPWTRDAAINTWNGAGLLFPQTTKNTLRSVLEEQDGGTIIGGQYWDAIIWVIGAWWQYVYNGDQQFLAEAFRAAVSSLTRYEAREFNPNRRLFRGGAVYADGIAAYPDIYAEHLSRNSGILYVTGLPDDEGLPDSQNLPTYALSTNCVYYAVYQLLPRMAAALGQPVDPKWAKKALSLKAAINEHFWDDSLGHYHYLVDAFGGCDLQEGLGHSLAILFGIADRQQIAQIFANQRLTRAGIPCLSESFSRYDNAEGTDYGRQAGTVWPQIQGFWASAAAQHGRLDLFSQEFHKLTRLAYRDTQFAEVYHPDSTLMYGGVQESSHWIWASEKRQTWSATAYLRMILLDMIGLRFDGEKISAEPQLPATITKVNLTSLPWRGARVNVHIEGNGADIVRCDLDISKNGAY